ncbi:MAG: hypothetical protein FWC73_08485 [Defluviitaleaceae bacterium]|nr:hypothetical protein [Defluviitaleaceae bacterium]
MTRFVRLNQDSKVIILTDNEMLASAKLIRHNSIINLDETEDYAAIYDLTPDDLLILHIGIQSWMGRHKKLAHAFNKPDNIAAKYICIRPTITAKALLEGLNTPAEITDAVIKKCGNLPLGKPIRVKSKSGTDTSLVLTNRWIAPYTAHEPGDNAYLPPAEISYDVELDSANGIIVADITIGELRVRGELVDTFGLVDESVSLHITGGEITDITGGEMAMHLKAKLWKLPKNCRKLVELGFGLSQMTPSGIIGIDESIAGTCHFGFGSGSGNKADIHMDVVVGKFSVLLF